MCIIVDYSKKLVKSGYFGVIICNWWRKSEKSGYLLTKMLISLEIHTKTPNNRDFRHKNSQFEHFHAEYTENSEHLMRFFQKIGKFALFSVELTSKLTFWVENSKKIGFLSKTSTNFQTLFLQIVTFGYILAQKLKQSFYHTKIEVVILHKLYLHKHPQLL